jgi:hypothetical protein
MLTKLDLKKDLKHLYNPSAKAFSTVDVPSMNFLMIDGIGDPNTSTEYKEAVETLYILAYAVKFAARKKQAVDYSVMPLEGLWWADDMTAYTAADRDSWKWTMMIMQPEVVTQEMVAEIREEVQAKKQPPALAKLRFEPLPEGLSVQILYFGPFKNEGPTIARLHTFIHDNGYTEAGKHHEIYLSDLRRTDPEKLKTVIRQPMQKLPE